MATISRGMKQEFRDLVDRQNEEDGMNNKNRSKSLYHQGLATNQNRFQRRNNFNRMSQVLDRPSQPTVQDMVKLKQFRLSLRYYDQLGAVMGLLGLIIAVFEFENFYPNYHSTLTNDILRSIISFTTLVLVFCIVRRSYIQYLIQVEKKIIPPNMRFHQTRHFTLMTIEVLFNAIHCPPRLDTHFYADNIKTQIRFKIFFNLPRLSLDGIFMTIMLLRIYLLSRIFAHNSKWLSDFAQEQADKVNCEANITFAIKALLKEKPLLTLVFFIIFSDLILALAVRHYELAFYENVAKEPEAGYQDYSQLINSIWFIMITMLTIGYGDYFPKTHIGRFICIVACFLGVFIISMIVVSVTNQITLSKNEAQAFDVLYKRTLKLTIKDKASQIISCYFKLHLSQKQKLKPKVVRLKNQLNSLLQEFRDLRKNLYEEETTTNEILRQITDKMKKDLSEIKKSLTKINHIRESLTEIESSQDIVLTTMAEVNKMSKILDEILMQHRFKKK